MLKELDASYASADTGHNIIVSFIFLINNLFIISSCNQKKLHDHLLAKQLKMFASAYSSIRMDYFCKSIGKTNEEAKESNWKSFLSM